MKSNFIYFFISFLLCSCTGNGIEFDVHTQTVSSDYGSTLITMEVVDNSTFETWRIDKKPHHHGLSKIRLCEIDTNYVVSYYNPAQRGGEKILQSHNITLKPDRMYLISNTSIPDASEYSVAVYVDSAQNCNIIKYYDRTVTLCLSYNGYYGQIIQFTATELQYGMGDILLDDKELLQNISWDKSDYVVRKHKLSIDQINAIQRIISEAETLKFKDNRHAVKSGKILKLYVSTQEIVRGYEVMLDTYPKNIQKAINELLEIASPFEIIEGNSE
jgi:hypothetical protein